MKFCPLSLLPLSLSSLSRLSLSLCVSSLLSLSRASVLFVFCARRFDRFADGGHRGFNKQMHEFCKALQEAHNRLLLLLLILLLFILLHCVFVVEGKERKGK
jgi:hypothetical protein